MPVLWNRLGRRGRGSAGAALATAAVTAVTVALVSACGSGAPGNVEATAQACAPGVTNNEIKLGILYPDTGLLAPQFTGFRFGIDARIDAANAAGGVGGRQISTDWRDDRFEASGNLQAAEELLREDVFAVLEYTAYSEASASLLHDAGVPVIGVGDNAGWSDFDNMFPLAYQLDDSDTTTTLGAFIRAQGGTTAAIVTTPIVTSARLYAEAARKSLEAAGVRVVLFDTTIGTNSPAAVERIVHSGADSIVSLSPIDLYATVLSQAAQAGRPFRAAVSPMTYDVSLLNTDIGRALAGSFSPVGFSVIERQQAAQQAFLSTMRTYAPEIQPATQLSSVYGYIAADMFLRGLETQQGCPSRASYLQGLRGISDYDGAGLLNQKLDFTAVERTMDLCSDFVQVAAGGTAFQPVGNGPVCGQPLRGGTSATG